MFLRYIHACLLYKCYSCSTSSYLSKYSTLQYSQRHFFMSLNVHKPRQFTLLYYHRTLFVSLYFPTLVWLLLSQSSYFLLLFNNTTSQMPLFLITFVHCPCLKACTVRRENFCLWWEFNPDQCLDRQAHWPLCHHGINIIITKRQWTCPQKRLRYHDQKLHVIPEGKRGQPKPTWDRIMKTEMKKMKHTCCLTNKPIKVVGSLAYSAVTSAKLLDIPTLLQSKLLIFH